jgi:PTH1 family peptidyl-tRNA hydrolase
MNNSGKGIKSLITNYQLPIANLWVVHDELDLPLGKIKIVKNRGSAGHKGVESIIKELGTKNFLRFRIGIKSSTAEGAPATEKEKFVLQKFKKREEKIVKEVIKKTCQAIETALKEGIDKAMTEFNK